MATVELRGPGTIGSDRLIASHAAHGELAAALADLLAARGFAPRHAPLAELHGHLPSGAAELDDTYMNAVTRSFYVLDERVHAAYRRLIAETVRSVLDCDVLFQAAPIVRFHPPARFPPTLRTATGQGSQFHSDILGGHPVRMINGWLALTPTFGTNALHLAGLPASIAILEAFAAGWAPEAGNLAGTLAGFYAAQRDDAAFAGRVAAACTSLAMAPGDLVLFDARCIHGGAENVETATRVSLDFRLVPLPDEPGEFEATLAAAHPRWRRGEILDAGSAHALAGNRPTINGRDAASTAKPVTAGGWTGASSSR
ncbi:MAG: hypothetical protein R3F55_08685 [Alphaproteobacteria bacterium]